MQRRHFFTSRGYNHGLMAEPPVFAEVEFPPVVSEPLDCSATLGVSAQCIVLRHFREMLEQREHAWHADEVEAVHRLRVAARRTRTALQTFGSLWEGNREAQQHLKTLSDFADAFNSARDLDVMFIYRNEQLGRADDHRNPAITWLLTRNEKLREEQRPRLHKALRLLEKKRVPEKFVSYFSRKPFDLWPPVDIAGRGGAVIGEGEIKHTDSSKLKAIKDENQEPAGDVGDLTGEAPAQPSEDHNGTQ